MTRSLCCALLLSVFLLTGCASQSDDPRAQARARYLERIAAQKEEEARKLRRYAVQLNEKARLLEQEAKVYKQKAKAARKGQDLPEVFER